MERLSFKKLNQMIEEFNKKNETDLHIFPNMYGYGIARKGGWQQNIFNGKALSTYWQYTLATVNEVDEKRKKWWLWIAELGWIKYHHFKPTKSVYEDFIAPPLANDEMENVKDAQPQQPDHLPTEVKVDENNQLLLF